MEQIEVVVERMRRSLHLAETSRCSASALQWTD